MIVNEFFQTENFNNLEILFSTDVTIEIDYAIGRIKCFNDNEVFTYIDVETADIGHFVNKIKRGKMKIEV